MRCAWDALRTYAIPIAELCGRPATPASIFGSVLLMTTCRAVPVHGDAISTLIRTYIIHVMPDPVLPVDTDNGLLEVCGTPCLPSEAGRGVRGATRRRDLCHSRRGSLPRSPSWQRGLSPSPSLSLPLHPSLSPFLPPFLALALSLSRSLTLAPFLALSAPLPPSLPPSLPSLASQPACLPACLPA